MDPADWNWADFIGVRLAQVLAGHGDRLAPGLRDRVRAALHHAAMAIFRRNADPGYTNIAVMGAVTVAAAAEILHAATPASPGLGPLGSGLLLEYARRRLRAVLTLHDEAGGFTEYNSPAYGRVVLEELERAALIVADPEFRELAERLRERTWAALAARFHPATGQLAGPMSRAYHDWIQPGLAGYLRAQTGAAIVAREEPRDAPLLVPPLLVPPLPCPRTSPAASAPSPRRLTPYAPGSAPRRPAPHGSTRTPAWARPRRSSPGSSAARCSATGAPPTTRPWCCAPGCC
ncbi:hypothetical protein [Thermocatellispora tengchongensis]|uniref:hypothetical protein n=1 Tax=Thermocatellispora tengchongensis TaxID=1073253 RepID=UPI00363DBD4F